MSYDDQKVPLSGKPPDPACINSGAPQPINPATGMHGDYWVLSKEERAKGFCRPVRRTYVHVGPKQSGALRDLNDDEKERYAQFGYVKFESYRLDAYVEAESNSAVVGKFWTQAELDRRGGCGTSTTMGTELAETYAADPKFYGSTFCCACRAHFPVNEFRWEDGTEVGS